LARTLDDWQIGAKATLVKGYNTVIPATPIAELEKLATEVEESYVGWKPRKEKRNKVEKDN
jgi:hypothetical protein